MNKTEAAIFDGFRKRDGMVVPFSREKIVLAISRAADEVHRRDHDETVVLCGTR